MTGCGNRRHVGIVAVREVRSLSAQSKEPVPRVKILEPGEVICPHLIDGDDDDEFRPSGWLLSGAPGKGEQSQYETDREEEKWL